MFSKSNYNSRIDTRSSINIKDNPLSKSTSTIFKKRPSVSPIRGEELVKHDLDNSIEDYSRIPFKKREGIVDGWVFVCSREKLIQKYEKKLKDQREYYEALIRENSETKPLVKKHENELQELKLKNAQLERNKEIFNSGPKSNQKKIDQLMSQNKTLENQLRIKESLISNYQKTIKDLTKKASKPAKEESKFSFSNKNNDSNLNNEAIKQLRLNNETTKELMQARINEKETEIQFLLDKLKNLDEQTQNGKTTYEYFEEELKKAQDLIEKLKTNEQTLIMHNKHLEKKLLSINSQDKHLRDLMDSNYSNTRKLTNLENRNKILSHENEILSLNAFYDEYESSNLIKKLHTSSNNMNECFRRYNKTMATNKHLFRNVKKSLKQIDSSQHDSDIFVEYSDKEFNFINLLDYKELNVSQKYNKSVEIDDKESDISQEFYSAEDQISYVESMQSETLTKYNHPHKKDEIRQLVSFVEYLSQNLESVTLFVEFICDSFCNMYVKDNSLVYMIDANTLEFKQQLDTVRKEIGQKNIKVKELEATVAEMKKMLAVFEEEFDEIGKEVVVENLETEDV